MKNRILSKKAILKMCAKWQLSNVSARTFIDDLILFLPSHLQKHGWCCGSVVSASATHPCWVTYYKSRYIQDATLRRNSVLNN